MIKIKFKGENRILENNIMDINHIKDAKKALKPFIKKTALKYSHFLSSLCQGTVYLKLEIKQGDGSSFGNTPLALQAISGGIYMPRVARIKSKSKIYHIIEEQGTVVLAQ